MPAGVAGASPPSVRFYGVRGSTPCEGPRYERYGGHTSCVALEVDDEPPILFDLGTGLRVFGEDVAQRQAVPPRAFTGTVLVSHLHWDHVQGLPFFAPLHHPSTVLDVIGPRHDEGSLAEMFDGLMRPPYFPFRPRDVAATLRFSDAGDDDFLIGDAKVRSRWIRHTGPTLGYRIEWRGVSIAYVSDHGPGVTDDADDFVPRSVLELCDGVDVLIHDSQHTFAEFGPRRHWGHSTVDYAVHVARESGAHSLAMFHHCPSHSDDDLDRLLVSAEDLGARLGVPEVYAARDGLRVDCSSARR